MQKIRRGTQNDCHQLYKRPLLPKLFLSLLLLPLLPPARLSSTKLIASSHVFAGDVTTRPFRRDALFPAVDPFEILSWKPTALALLAEAGQLREPTEFRGVTPFLLLPFSGEEAPLPEERFVADVEIALSR